MQVFKTLPSGIVPSMPNGTGGGAMGTSSTPGVPVVSANPLYLTANGRLAFSEADFVGALNMYLGGHYVFEANGGGVYLGLIWLLE